MPYSIPSTRLTPDFFAQDPLLVARQLLGGLIVHDHPELGPLVGRVVETEAYRGEEDEACHARAGRTTRTQVLYGPPGRAYVYLIYGMYHMFNVVSWPEGDPAAVLVRALEPVFGLDGQTNGPGKLCRAMRIDRSLNGVDLSADQLFILTGDTVDDHDVLTGPRIGIDYAGDWASRPWRFYLRDNKHVSAQQRSKSRGGSA